MRKHMGDVCASIPNTNAKTERKYNSVRIGRWFDDEGRISLILEAVPLPHTGWNGWINLYEKGDGSSHAKTAEPKQPTPFNDDDEIPF
jgi:hypothetical protein